MVVINLVVYYCDNYKVRNANARSLYIEDGAWLNNLCEFFFPCHSAASGAAVMAIILGETTIAFTIYGGTAFSTSENIFDSHGVGGLVVLNSFFSASGDAFDVVAVDLVNDFSVIFPLACVLHTTFACV